MRRTDDQRPLVACACLVAAVLAWLTMMAAHGEPARVLRVCADPNNLPFSNKRGEGFENRLAELVAGELGARVEYTWQAQRRGFLRTTLKARRCDVVMGIPAAAEQVLATAPYYRSSYVFVTRPEAGPPVRSFDDPRLRTLRIGVPLVGDDGANPPPVHALTARGIVDNVRGYSVYGDYRDADPPLALLAALERGEIDVAVAWGPFAGWYALRAHPLVIVPTPERDRGLPMTFAIAMGVRRDDRTLHEELEQALARRRDDVARLVADFGVPLVGGGR